MVITRAADEVAPTDPRPPGPAQTRVVARPPGIPSARALVGGVLVAAAGVGTFVSWQAASGPPDHSYAVATRALAPGERLAPDMVRFEPIDLPAAVAGPAFDSPGELEGRVLVAPVGEGELVQAGSVSDQVGGPPAAEVSVTLGRDLAVDGRLRPGDTVDVFATGDATAVAAHDLQVVTVTDAGDSFAEGSELTVTLALTDPGDAAPIIHAAREGKVTLVRTTHAPGATTSSDSTRPPGGSDGGGAGPVAEQSPEGADGSVEVGAG